MSNSNSKILRKKISKEVSDEIFTINSEIDNLSRIFKDVDLKSLSKVSYTRIKSIRRDLNLLSTKISKVNTNLKHVKDEYWGSLIVDDDDNNRKILVPKHIYNNKLNQIEG